jgi:hypothetical protein
MMDVAMAMAMDGLLATQQQWTDDGDGSRDGDGDEWHVGNATTMDELLAA